MQRETIEGFRLSPQQQRLWLLQQENARSGARTNPYRAQCALLIEGDLKPEVLQAALQCLVNQQEILRTGFYRQPGIKIPIQVIADRATLCLQQVDFSHLPLQEQETRMAEWFEAAAATHQLEQDSLLHTSLLTLSAHRHILLLALPALCADGQTLQNFLPAIGRAYASVLKGDTLSQEDVVQYIQFAEWQHELLASEDAEAGRNYWQQQLRELPPLTLAGNPRATPFAPQTYSLRLDSSLITRMRAIAQHHQATVAGFLLACWQILLWRLGRLDAVNAIHSGRPYEELREVLGLLAKPLPIRCPLQGDFQFTEVLQRTGKMLQQSERWQEYFLGEDSSNPAMKPVNPMSFEFETWPDSYAVDGVIFSLSQRYVCLDRYQIKLTCCQAESLLAEFDYDASLFTPAQIHCLASQFQALLNQVAHSPDLPLHQFELLSPAERQWLLVELNQTQTAYPQDQCVHHLFAAQAARTPQATAVVYEDQQLTYGELNTRANQLAHYLQTLGVGPEVIVGLYVERSLEMVIGLLGILKAGGAYLPLDPALPPAGVANRLQQAQVSLLLTQQSVARDLQLPNLKLLYLDSDWERIAPAPTVLVGEATPENLLYVLFTSGSTGQPKGVAVEHRQLLNYLYGILDQLALPPGAGALVSTLAADLGNTIIYSTLCTGGCLHILAQERAADPVALTDYWQRHPIDCLKIVPSHLAALLTGAQPERILPRQHLILGGEACPWPLVEQLQALAPGCRILNHYGPTETTVGALTYAVENSQASSAPQTVPLGRPLANVQVYVLDQHLQPVPMGVPGELYIGGAGVARGYCGQLALTAERFIPHPFSSDPGARLYKSGDWVCYQPDGTLDFRGRRDYQVKIRGFRIELGEIEGVLKQHPGVREAVVSVDDAGDQQRLVAYVVAPQQTSPSELRGFLKEYLPEYMVPAAVVMLQTFPLTPNGKVDRQALPSPEIKLDLAVTYQPPRTAIEQKLAEIWATVLGLERVGIHDNFFELGGHSLLATQLMSRLRDTFQVELPLHHFFTAPTVAELAVLITQSLAEKTESDLLAQTLAEVAQLSEEEVQALLTAEN